MKVKVCGITNLPDALLCESLGADALGFIFYNKSKRFVTPDEANGIIKKLSAFTIKVGVFVNEQIDEVNLIADKLKLNIVQLHGDETPEYKNQIDYPVIKSFRIKEDFDFACIEEYNTAGSGITPLLDTFKSGEYGGTGKTFNWEIIPDKIRNTIILAGGISIENIESIYTTICPFAVDVSSSLEYETGKKDKKKTVDFINKIKELRRSAW